MNINFNYKNSNSRRELINKILLTIIIIALFRLGSFIPIPNIDQEYLYSELKKIKILNLFSSFAQGNFFVLGIFSLGILPNINASILIQILSTIIPSLKRLQREEGEFGKKQIKYATRVLTGLIAFQYGLIIGTYIKPFVFEWSFFYSIEIALVLTMGSLIIMLFSEIIDEYGIGNGISLFIFVNISSSLPLILENLKFFLPLTIQFIFLVVFLIAVFCLIITQNATRTITVVSNKQLLRPSIRTENTYLPFRLNPSGIMPVIFASSLINIIFALIKNITSISSSSTWIYIVSYFFLTLLFSYIYSSLIINPNDLARDLKNLGFIIPSIAPGISTAKFLQDVVNRLALLGGFFLSIAVLLPLLFVFVLPDINDLNGIGSTSLIILVGVAIDLNRQIQTDFISKSYDKIRL